MKLRLKFCNNLVPFREREAGVPGTNLEVALSYGWAWPECLSISTDSNLNWVLSVMTETVKRLFQSIDIKVLTV